MNENIKASIDKHLGLCLPLQRSRTTELFHDLMHCRVVTKGLWHKVRIYVRFPILTVNHEEYQRSQFFQCFSCFDDTEFKDGNITLFAVLCVIQSNCLFEANANQMAIDYKLQDALNQLNQKYPLLKKLMTIEYDEHWNPILKRYPHNIQDELTAAAIRELALHEKIVSEDFTVEDVASDHRLNTFTKKCTYQLVPTGKTISDCIGYLAIKKLTLNSTVFEIHSAVAFWVKDNNGNEFDYPKGQIKAALFIVTKHERLYIPSKQRYLKDILIDLFSRQFERIRMLYEEVSQGDLKKIYWQESFVSGQCIDRCAVGDLLYYNRQGSEDIKAAVYIGNGELLQPNPTTNEKEFQKMTVNAFIGEAIQYKLVVRRLWFNAFKAEDIIRGASECKRKMVTNENGWFSRGLHLPLELLSGRIKDCWEEIRNQANSPSNASSILF